MIFYPNQNHYLAYIKQDLNWENSWRRLSDMDINDTDQTWIQVIERNNDGWPSFLMYEKVSGKLREKVSIWQIVKIGQAYDICMSTYNVSSFASIA